jgi:hypothetical protein
MKYRIESERIKGEIAFTFQNGLLQLIELNLQEPLEADQIRFLLPNIPYYEEEAEQMNYKLTKVPDTGSNLKLTLFCEYYTKYYKGIKYKVSSSDAGKIKHYEVNDKLLQTYFTSENFLFVGKHCISNMVKYYNQLRTEVENVNPHKFPNKWSRDYFKNLAISLHRQYYDHLRSLGYKPVMRDRQIIDWT